MYRKLTFNNRIRKGIDLLAGREFKQGPSGKLEPKGLEGARPMPWIFVNHDARKKFCWFWNQVSTGVFRHIPTHCRHNCWKIVIKPRNVKETFETYEILKTLDLPAKIGMDLRDYTYGAWAGFIYSDTVEQGQEYWEAARSAIPNRIPIILKRGCTEMERLMSSDRWDTITEGDLEVERELNDTFNFQERHYVQAAWYKREIREAWIKHAIKIGDPTARETAEKYSGDPNIWQKLVVESVTYHKEKGEKDNG